jgi:hypothetical protein
MGKAGIRGIRLNLATGGVNDPNVGRPRFSTAVERVKARGWHVQLFTSLPMITAIKDLVLTSPVPVVFDHFGGAQDAAGEEREFRGVRVDVGMAVAGAGRNIEIHRRRGLRRLGQDGPAVHGYSAGDGGKHHTASCQHWCSP